MFSATHFLKGPSCLNSPGTPQQLFVTLRRQPNSTEKSVNATISCAEQRPFKTPQLPALRADVTGRRRHRRPRRLSCYTFNWWGHPRFWGKRVPAPVTEFCHTVPARVAKFLWWARCRPAPIRPTQRLTGPNGAVFSAFRETAFSLSTVL